MIARTCSRRVILSTPVAEVFEALRYLECDPEIAGKPIDVAFSAEPHRSCFRIVQEGKVIGEQPSAQGVTESLHAELLNLSLADFPAAPIMHAASLRCRGRRVLLVGPKGGGKTTLTLRLIQEGYEIEGDENVFVTPEGVVARPRGLRVKQSATAVLPHLAQTLAVAPYYQADSGERIYNLDPRQAGAACWRIEEGPVSGVVLVQPNHGGGSSLQPVAPLDVVRRVVEESAFPEAGRAEALGAIAQVIRSAKGFELALGDLDGAVACMEKVCQHLD